MRILHEIKLFLLLFVLPALFAALFSEKNVPIFRDGLPFFLPAGLSLGKALLSFSSRFSHFEFSGPEFYKIYQVQSRGFTEFKND